MIIGSTAIRGTGSTKREATIRHQTERKILNRLRYSGHLQARESRINVDSSGKLDQLKYQLEFLREHGAPRFERHHDLTSLQEDLFHLAHIEPVVAHGIAFRCAMAMGGGLAAWFADTTRGKRASDQFATFDRKTRYLRHRVPRLATEMMLFGETAAVFLRQGQGETGPAIDMRILDPVTRHGGFAGPEFEKFDEDAPESLRGMVDVERIKGYKRRGMTMTETLLPPDIVTHWVWKKWGNDIRGRPLLEPCHDELWQLRDASMNTTLLMQWLQRVMTFIIHIESEELGEEIEAGDVDLSIPDFLSMYMVPPGAKLEVPTLKDHLEFGDKFSRGPEYLPERRIAQTLQIPLHFLRMEFNEGNFASFKTAEGPWTALASRDAEKIEDFVLDDMEKVLPEFDAGEDYAFTVVPLVLRDKHKEIEQLIEARLNRDVSRQTLHERMDLDPEIEESRLADERGDLEAMRQENPNGIDEESDNGDRAQESAPTVHWQPYRPYISPRRL